MIVEVFNASGRAGLGRVGTRVLRREGIDVVALGTVSDSAGTLDTTRIVVRRGSLAAATAIRNALGVGRVFDAARQYAATRCERVPRRRLFAAPRVPPVAARRRR